MLKQNHINRTVLHIISYILYLYINIINIRETIFYAIAPFSGCGKRDLGEGGDTGSPTPTEQRGKREDMEEMWQIGKSALIKHSSILTGAAGNPKKKIW